MEVLGGTVVACADEMGADTDEKLDAADEEEEELESISNALLRRLKTYLSISSTAAFSFFPSRYLPRRSPILTS
jgi:hypothetical protein